MKKLILLVLSFIMVLSVASCGSSEKKLYGTWEIKEAEIDGSKFSAVEILSMGDKYGIGDFRVTIKKDGKAFLYKNLSGNLVDWEYNKDDKTVEIGHYTFDFKKKKLILEYNNNCTIYLTRTSKSQDIPLF